MRRLELDAWVIELESTLTPIVKEINELKPLIDLLKKRIEFLDNLPVIAKDQILRNDYTQQVNEWEKRLGLLLQDQTRFIKIRDEVINASRLTLT